MQAQKLIEDPTVRFLPQRSIKPDTPHSLERKVRHELLLTNAEGFESIVVHRIHNGVCLEGYIGCDSDASDACRIAKKVKGVNKVLNHLMIKKN